MTGPYKSIPGSKQVLQTVNPGGGAVSFDAHFADAVTPEAAALIVEALNRPAWIIPVREERVAHRRKDLDLSGWPPGTTQEAAQAAVDRVCGCAGKWDCACVSVFNRACQEAWYAHNTKPAAPLGSSFPYG